MPVGRPGLALPLQGPWAARGRAEDRAGKEPAAQVRAASAAPRLRDFLFERRERFGAVPGASPQLLGLQRIIQGDFPFGVLMTKRETRGNMVTATGNVK